MPQKTRCKLDLRACLTYILFWCKETVANAATWAKDHPDEMKAAAKWANQNKVIVPQTYDDAVLIITQNAGNRTESRQFSLEKQGHLGQTCEVRTERKGTTRIQSAGGGGGGRRRRGAGGGWGGLWLGGFGKVPPRSRIPRGRSPDQALKTILSGSCIVAPSLLAAAGGATIVSGSGIPA